MKALVYHGPGRKAWEEVPKPSLVHDTDAIVRVDAGTICGTDLHILKGDVPTVDDGRILGHEAVGTVEQVGSGVKNVRPGDTVAVVGAGPIGLAAIMGARLYSPSHIVAIDPAAARLEAAKQFGADVVVNNSTEDPLAVVRDLTDGLGADVAIEAVGLPETFELTTALIRPGGRAANIGVHGRSVTLHLEELWIKDVTVTTGLVDTYSTPTLLKLVANGQLAAEQFATHHFALD